MCTVTVAIDRTRGDDPVAVIDEAVADFGWRREGETVWVDRDGFRIEARVEPSDPAEDLAEHAVDWSVDVRDECADRRLQAHPPQRERIVERCAARFWSPAQR